MYIKLDRIKEIYEKSPEWIKAPLGIAPLSSILGREYRSTKSFLIESDGWSKRKLEDHQFKQLQETVRFAATTTPYYKKLFKKLDINPLISDFDEFKKIPYLTKEELKRAGSDLFSLAVPEKSKYRVTTGGTTGVPQSLMMSNAAYAREWAFVHHYLSQYGIAADDRKLSLRGIPLVGDAADGPYYKYNPIYKELQISPFHLTEEIITKLCSRILEFKPVYLHGYPSALEAFARITQKLGQLKALRLKGVLATSETLYPEQKKFLESTYKCQVFSFYGHTERVIFAGDKPLRDSYFPDPRYGYTEFADDELVGTGFINMATPLLRYRTGDKAVVSENTNNHALSSFPIITQLKGGRGRCEMVLGRTGTLISATALNMHSNIFDNVEKYQIYQDKIGVIELRVVPLSTFKKEIEISNIIKGFKEKVGDELEILVKLVDKIELTNRQKQLFVIQRLDIT
jgi:phenylacetate-CoA ligase